MQKQKTMYFLRKRKSIHMWNRKMSENNSKNVHDQIQDDVKEYMTNTSSSVLDFALVNAIKSCQNNLNDLCEN